MVFPSPHLPGYLQIIYSIRQTIFQSTSHCQSIGIHAWQIHPQTSPVPISLSLQIELNSPPLIYLALRHNLLSNSPRMSRNPSGPELDSYWWQHTKPREDLNI